MREGLHGRGHADGGEALAVTQDVNAYVLCDVTSGQVPGDRTAAVACGGGRQDQERMGETHVCGLPSGVKTVVTLAGLCEGTRCR